MPRKLERASPRLGRRLKQKAHGCSTLRPPRNRDREGLSSKRKVDVREGANIGKSNPKRAGKKSEHKRVQSLYKFKKKILVAEILDNKVREKCKLDPKEVEDFYREKLEETPEIAGLEDWSGIKISQVADLTKSETESLIHGAPWVLTVSPLTT